MRGTASTQQSLAAQVGQHVYVELRGGQVLDGTLTRVDARNLRLRPTHRGGLLFVARREAAAITVGMRPAA